MRHAVSSVTIVLGLVGAIVAPAGAALAAPAAAPVLVAAPKKKCTVEDKRLRELSGLVATGSGYVVINDGSGPDSHKRVFYLNSKCAVTKEVRYSSPGSYDPEDLALGPDGKTLWIADIGDKSTNKTRRERVAVWTMPLDGSKQPVLHRLSYPQRKPHDAQALLVGDDNLPLIITRDASGTAEIFKPEAQLKSGDTEPVPMKKVGEVTIPKTSTENKLGATGRATVTGAARSPDGTKVVLRTYADAFEYDVTGGDIVAALTDGKPRITPLTDPFGEAISYTPDGKLFVTISDGGLLESSDPIDILSYVPSTTGADAPPGAGDEGAKPAATTSWFDGLTLNQITYLIAAVGVLGALMVGAGIFGILRARRKPAPAAEPADEPTRDDAPPGNGVPLHGGRSDTPPPGGPRGGVYGGGGGYGDDTPVNGAPGRAPAGGVYGGGRPQDGGGRGGGVYGGGQQSGGVYGAGRQGGGHGGAPQDRGHGGAPHDRGHGGAPQGRGHGGGRPPGGGVYSGAPQGGGVPQGGGRYGGGRGEPPRREPDPRGPRAGRRGDSYDDRGQYGPMPDGRDYRSDRY
ncbi:hypothetical protein ABZ671_18040 [Micromonospora sp. NPDC006766]|uniref:hypothetical protein n=1 Tax=Micromonospora sp. NPDC006766 TaxID=3154778 RepID=UPI0033EFB7DE